MKVLLISANVTASPYPVYPIGIEYVAGALAPRHEVRLLDMNVPDGPDPLRRAVGEFAPDLVGLSLRNIDNVDTVNPKSYIDGYRDLVERLRACTPAPLVLGGSGFSIFPGELMALLKADFGIVGAGETLGRLIEALETGADPSAVPGVAVAGGAIPAPVAWTETRARRIQPPPALLEFYLKRGGILNLQTQRGCPYRCLYCTYPHLDGRRPRPDDPESAGETARRLQDLGAGYLFITDSVFNADWDHSLSVARAFRRHGVTVPWGAFFAPTRPPGGYYEALGEAGLSHVEFGTESLSDAMLDAYRKPFSVAEAVAAHEAARRAGLHVAHYFLLGGPGEDGRTLDETLCNAETLERAVFFFFCGVRIFPFTPLHERALAEGQIAPGQNLLTPVFYRSPGIAAPDIMARVHRQAGGRNNWVYGDGGRESERVVSRLHAYGHPGPLWELLLR